MKTKETKIKRKPKSDSELIASAKRRLVLNQLDIGQNGIQVIAHKPPEFYEKKDKFSIKIEMVTLICGFLIGMMVGGVLMRWLLV